LVAFARKDFLFAIYFFDTRLTTIHNVQDPSGIRLQIPKTKTIVGPVPKKCVDNNMVGRTCDKTTFPLVRNIVMLKITKPILCT
jgi:hypothetical protein